MSGMTMEQVLDAFADLCRRSPARPAGEAVDLQLRLEVSLEPQEQELGRVVLAVASSTAGEGSGQPHRLIVEGIRRDRPRGAAAKSEVKLGGPTAVSQDERGAEAAVAGIEDLGALSRRLELVLGGPPGFTTGARAEVLADLLAEVAPGALVECIRRDWVTHFDTGADASQSVGRPAGTVGEGQKEP